MDGRHIVELLRVPADELAPYLTARSGRTTRACSQVRCQFVGGDAKQLDDVSSVHSHTLAPVELHVLPRGADAHLNLRRRDDQPTHSCQVPGLMETIKPGGTSMVAPRKYPEELRERSIRMTLDARQDPASRPS